MQLKQRRRPTEKGYKIIIKLGKDNRHSPEEANPLSAKDCLNSIPIGEQLQKRNGFALGVTAPAKVTCLFKFERPTITEELITTLTGLYKRNVATVVALKTDFTSSEVYNIVNYNNMAIISNGINYIQKYDGTTVANLIGSPPAGSVTAVMQDRLWIIAISGEENIVHFSDFANPESWPIWNVINIYTPDGDTLQSVIEHLGQPTFLKKNSLHVLYGTSEENYNLQRKPEARGTISHRTVHISGGLLVRLAPDMKVWGWTGNEDICLSKDFDFGINKAYAYKSQAWLDNRGLSWLAVPTGVSTECNSLFVGKNIEKHGWQWYPVVLPWNINCFGWFSDRLTVGRVDGLIDIEQDVFNDEGVAIDAYWQSQNISGDIAEYFKQFTTIAVEAKKDAAGTLEVSWIDEKGAIGTQTISTDKTENIIDEVLYIQSFAKHLSFKVRNNQLNHGFNTYSLSGRYNQKLFG